MMVDYKEEPKNTNALETSTDINIAPSLDFTNIFLLSIFLFIPAYSSYQNQTHPQL